MKNLFSLGKESLMGKRKLVDSFLRGCELDIRLVTFLIVCVVFLWLLLALFLIVSVDVGFLPANSLWVILVVVTLLFLPLFSVLLQIRHDLKQDHTEELMKLQREKQNERAQKQERLIVWSRYEQGDISWDGVRTFLVEQFLRSFKKRQD